MREAVVGKTFLIISTSDDNVSPLEPKNRPGNNAVVFRRHNIQIPYGSSKRFFKTDPELQLNGNITEPANHPQQQTCK